MTPQTVFPKEHDGDSVEVAVWVRKQFNPIRRDTPTHVAVEVEGRPIDAWGLNGETTKTCESMRILLSPEEAREVARHLITAADIVSTKGEP